MKILGIKNISAITLQTAVGFCAAFTLLATSAVAESRQLLALNTELYQARTEYTVFSDTKIKDLSRFSEGTTAALPDTDLSEFLIDSDYQITNSQSQLMSFDKPVSKSNSNQWLESKASLIGDRLRVLDRSSFGLEQNLSQAPAKTNMPAVFVNVLMVKF